MIALAVNPAGKPDRLSGIRAAQSAASMGAVRMHLCSIRKTLVTTKATAKHWPIAAGEGMRITAAVKPPSPASPDRRGHLPSRGPLRV